jgi:hypothetical protein
MIENDHEHDSVLPVRTSISIKKMIENNNIKNTEDMLQDVNSRDRQIDMMQSALLQLTKEITTLTTKLTIIMQKKDVKQMTNLSSSQEENTSENVRNNANSGRKSVYRKTIRTVIEKSIRTDSGCCNLGFTLCGIEKPRGKKIATVERWNSLSLLAAILTSVAAGGLFISAEFAHTYNEELSTANSSSIEWTTNNNKKKLAKWTTILWCIDTFCFLNTTVLSAFFVAFASRHPNHTLEQIYESLGIVFHWPEIYFRISFLVMIGCLSSFFVLVIDTIEMTSCLSICITFLVLPMCFATSRAFSIFKLVAV